MNRADLSSPFLVNNIVKQIKAQSTRPLTIMEFCGTHSHVVYRYGFRHLLPKTITMLSGPGCPVCVTSTDEIDSALTLASLPGVTVATFGDLLRVPGSQGDFLTAKAKGAHIKIVYSPLDAVRLAAANPRNKVVFLGIGFETTAPAVAASILQAKRDGLRNYSVLSMHKITPPAMKAILDAHDVSLDGVLCPGHVSAITGCETWQFLSDHYRIPGVVAGFEPVDVLLAIKEIVRQHETGESTVKNAYPRSVTARGNTIAVKMMNEVFKLDSAVWRGIGMIPASGLLVNHAFGEFDARSIFHIERTASTENADCHCGYILRGVMAPRECPLFGSTCTPINPVGPCMVSSEGSCAASYHYG